MCSGDRRSSIHDLDLSTKQAIWVYNRKKEFRKLNEELLRGMIEA